MHPSRPRQLLAVVAALVLSLGGVSAALAPSARAAGTYAGFEIDGSVPDPDLPAEAEFADQFGNTKELGPKNGNTTKVGPINTAPVPMLSETNPNGQVDLRSVWFDKATDTTTQDTWLYFAWERDANSGSGFIAIEISKEGLAQGCSYPIDATDVETCNPWASRAVDDTLLLWDQSGNSKDIYIRTFDGTAWGPATQLTAGQYDAEYSGDGFFGEAAINLNETGIINPDECEAIGNVIPSTVTGNSDSADYKDTVFAPIADFLDINTCATVTITKETVPADQDVNFDYTKDFVTLPTDEQVDTFTLNTGSETVPATMTWDNVKPSTADVNVTEATPPTGWELTGISCTNTNDESFDYTVDLVNRKVTFVVDEVEDDIECTFTNKGSGAIKIHKFAKHAAATTADKTIPLSGVQFTVTGDGVNETTTATDTNGDTCVAGLPIGSYTVSEPVAPEGYLAGPDQTVDVTAVGTCDTGTQATVEVENTPLTDITVTVDSQVDGGTASTIECTPTDDEGFDAVTDAIGDGSFSLSDLVPGTYTCEVVVDP